MSLSTKLSYTNEWVSKIKSIIGSDNESLESKCDKLVKLINTKFESSTDSFREYKIPNFACKYEPDEYSHSYATILSNNDVIITDKFYNKCYKFTYSTGEISELDTIPFSYNSNVLYYDLPKSNCIIAIEYVDDTDGDYTNAYVKFYRMLYTGTSFNLFHTINTATIYSSSSIINTEYEVVVPSYAIEEGSSNSSGCYYLYSGFQYDINNYTSSTYSDIRSSSDYYGVQVGESSVYLCGYNLPGCGGYIYIRDTSTHTLSRVGTTYRGHIHDIINIGHYKIINFINSYNYSDYYYPLLLTGTSVISLSPYSYSELSAIIDKNDYLYFVYQCSTSTRTYIRRYTKDQYSNLPTYYSSYTDILNYGSFKLYSSSNAKIYNEKAYNSTGLVFQLSGYTYDIAIIDLSDNSIKYVNRPNSSDTSTFEVKAVAYKNKMLVVTTSFDSTSSNNRGILGKYMSSSTGTLSTIKACIHKNITGYFDTSYIDSDNNIYLFHRSYTSSGGSSGSDDSVYRVNIDSLNTTVSEYINTSGINFARTYNYSGYLLNKPLLIWGYGCTKVFYDTVVLELTNGIFGDSTNVGVYQIPGKYIFSCSSGSYSLVYDTESNEWSILPIKGIINNILDSDIISSYTGSNSFYENLGDNSINYIELTNDNKNSKLPRLPDGYVSYYYSDHPVVIGKTCCYDPLNNKLHINKTFYELIYKDMIDNNKAVTVSGGMILAHYKVDRDSIIPKIPTISDNEYISDDSNYQYRTKFNGYNSEILRIELSKYLYNIFENKTLRITVTSQKGDSDTNVDPYIYVLDTSKVGLYTGYTLSRLKFTDSANWNYFKSVLQKFSLKYNDDIPNSNNNFSVTVDVNSGDTKYIDLLLSHYSYSDRNDYYFSVEVTIVE